MNIEPALPFDLQGDLEQAIGQDPAWRAGVEYGRPRHGHPEGKVGLHIAAVLANVERWYRMSPHYERLRLIALLHDTFKYAVRPDLPRTGENHHGMLARRFAERHVVDPAVLDVIELHDEAYNAWQRGNGDWDKAQRRAQILIGRLGENLALYLAFYHCDNATEGKQQDCLDWFQELVVTEVGP